MSNKKKKIAQASRLLQEGIDNIFNGDNFKQFLEAISRLPSYSYQNLILIVKQCPIATRLHTYKAWEKQNRFVREGEKAIRIRVPYRKIRDETHEEDTLLFGWINLFDISQTEAIRSGLEANKRATVSSIVTVPSPFQCKRLEGHVENFKDLLDAIRQASSFQVSFVKKIPEGANGRCWFGKAKIEILADLSQLHTIKTMVHEVAHSILHIESNLRRQQKEIEAESVAFVVCNYFGLDTSEYSFEYVASYGVDREKNDVCNFLDRIQVAASYLIDVIEGALKGQELGYRNNKELLILMNKKRVTKYFDEGKLVYLVFPNEGEYFVSNEEQIINHDGLFAVEKKVMQQNQKLRLSA